MPDEVRPPVAIRCMRPYATEEAFLAEEHDTLSKTAVTLIGAPSRPRGVIIRFEVTLNDGTAILRGEGRVLGFQAADERGPSALTLRFTRLDARSKALVDRADGLREADASVAEMPAGDTEPPPEDPLAATSMSTVAPAGFEAPPSSSQPVALAISSGNLPLADVEEVGGHAPLSQHDPAQRDTLLERLRARAKGMSPADVTELLAAGRARN